MKNWKQVLAALACAILGALSLASCESDGVPAPNPDDESVPAGSETQCDGNKADMAGCPLAVDPTDTYQGSQPDTAPLEPQKPAVNYTDKPCPGWGCTLFPTKIQCDDCWDRWDCGQPPEFPPPVAFTGEKTAWIPATCGLPEPTN